MGRVLYGLGQRARRMGVWRAEALREAGEVEAVEAGGQGGSLRGLTRDVLWAAWEWRRDFGLRSVALVIQCNHLRSMGSRERGGQGVCGM